MDEIEPAVVGRRPVDPCALPIGSIFQGRYQIVCCIKAGGMGAVYEAVHLETRRRRALKVMLPSLVADAELRARFKLEATIAADIESEYIVETLDAGVDDATGAPFLVMELLRGEDLSSLLKRQKRCSAEETLFFLSQAALALDRTHDAGIVHRDLKPDNLFICQREDGSPWLKVLDFGIAKVVAEAEGTAPQTRAIGTPCYMAPEQIRGDGKLGPRVDLYALGHIAYALLCGEPYWAEDMRALAAVFPLLLRVAAGPTEPPTARAARRTEVTLPAGFDAWFARATATDPAERFGRASAMVAALAEALGNSLAANPVATRPPATGGAVPTPTWPPAVQVRTIEPAPPPASELPGGPPSPTLPTGASWGTTARLSKTPPSPRLIGAAVVATSVILAGALGIGLSHRSPAPKPTTQSSGSEPASPALESGRTAPPPVEPAAAPTSPAVVPAPLASTTAALPSPSASAPELPTFPKPTAAPRRGDRAPGPRPDPHAGKPALTAPSRPAPPDASAPAAAAPAAAAAAADPFGPGRH